jgi:hypothetical protein
MFGRHRETYALDCSMKSIWVIRGLLVALTATLAVILILRGNVVIGVVLGALACARVALLVSVHRRRKELRQRFGRRMDARRQAMR